MFKKMLLVFTFCLVACNGFADQLCAMQRAKNWLSSVNPFGGGYVKDDRKMQGGLKDLQSEVKALIMENRELIRRKVKFERFINLPSKDNVLTKIKEFLDFEVVSSTGNNDNLVVEMMREVFMPIISSLTALKLLYKPAVLELDNSVADVLNKWKERDFLAFQTDREKFLKDFYFTFILGATRRFQSVMSLIERIRNKVVKTNDNVDQKIQTNIETALKRLTNLGDFQSQLNAHLDTAISSINPSHFHSNELDEAIERYISEQSVNVTSEMSEIKNLLASISIYKVVKNLQRAIKHVRSNSDDLLKALRKVLTEIITTVFNTANLRNIEVQTKYKNGVQIVEQVSLYQYIQEKVKKLVRGSREDAYSAIGL